MSTTSNFEVLHRYAEVLALLHARFTPHAGQLGPGRALFSEGAKRIFLMFARQVGKSYFMAYAAIRWAATHPGASVAIIGPFLNQAREIFLHSGLLERLCPPELLTGPPHKTEGRFTFTNGSVLKVYGADNIDALRGMTFDLVLVDEVKDIDPELFGILTPTLMVRKAPMVLCGTPPEVAEHHYWTLVDTAKSDPFWRIFHLSSYGNPYMDHAELDREREAYKKRGEEDVFIREYMAEFVPGQKRAIFPMLSAELHVQPYQAMRNKIYRRPDSWSYYVAMDPGTATVFAALIGAVNHYDGTVYIMDEVYANQQSETSIGKFYPRVQECMKELWDPDPNEEQFTVTVDEAATWARNELVDRYGQGSFPTEKASNSKMSGLSQIKDLLNARQIVISDRCVNLFKEMRGYMTNEQGLPIKRNDHCCDSLRYLIASSKVSTQTSPAPPIPQELEPGQRDEPKRFHTIDQDLQSSWSDIEPYLLDQLDD